MATPVTTLLYSVRRMIGDRRKGDPLVPSSFLEEMVTAAVYDLMDEVGTGLIQTASFVTLVSGTGTYAVTIPSSYPAILHLQELVDASTGYPLEKRPLSWILAMRVNNSDSKGVPRYFATTESHAQALTVEVYPAPQDAGSLTAFWEPVPKAPGVSGTVAADIEMSTPALVMLRTRVAAMTILALDPSILAKLSPPKSQVYGQMLMEQSKRMAEAEFARLHLGDMVDVVERNR